MWLVWSCDQLQIKSTHSLLGNNDEQRERSLGKLFNEVNIIKEQVLHFSLYTNCSTSNILYSCNIPTSLIIIKYSEKVNQYVAVLCCHGNNIIGGNLYIIMEYIEGLSLLQLCNSLKEKKKSFSEEQIWKMFTQVSKLLLVSGPLLLLI